MVGDTHSDSCSSCIPHLSSSTPPIPSSTPTLIHVYQSFPLRWQSLPVRSLPALADIKLPYNVLCLIVVFLSLIRELHSPRPPYSNKRQQHCFKCLHYRWHYLIAIFSFPRIRLMIQNRTKIKNVEHIILLRCHLNSIWVLHYTCLNPPPAISILKSLHSHWRLSLQYQNQPKNLNAWKLILKGNEQM